jgi:hypothetical protein
MANHRVRPTGTLHRRAPGAALIGLAALTSSYFECVWGREVGPEGGLDGFGEVAADHGVTDASCVGLLVESEVTDQR